MNQLIVYPEELVSENGAVITGDRAAYVHEWHDLSPGISIRAGIFGGQWGQATIKESSTSKVVLELDISEAPPSRIPIELIVAVPRPQTVRKILQFSTTMGLKHVHFVRSERIQKSYLHSHSIEKEAIDLELLKALEQAGDTTPPEVSVHPLFNPFIEDVLPRIVTDKNIVSLVADTDAKIETRATISDLSFKRALIAIGPERGWNDYERNLFSELGFHSVSLGERILRVETAVSVLVSQIRLYLGK